MPNVPVDPTQGLLRLFRTDQRGNVSMLFGGAVVTLFCCVGAAIDFARGHSVHTSLQGALDSALLAAARAKATRVGDPDEVLASYMQRIFTDHQSGAPSTTMSEVESGSLRATSTINLPTVFMRVAGYSEMTIRVVAEVGYGLGPTDLALIMDNTGSMEGAKIDGLKTAATNMLDTLFEAAGASDRIRVSLVPFAQYVNVGLEYRHEPWLSVADDSTTPREYCRNERPVIGTTNCRMQTFNGDNDGVPYSYQSEVCDYEYGPEAYVCTQYTENSTWNGCVGSRLYPLNMSEEIQSSNKVTGLHNISCTSPLRRLTSVRTDIQPQIDAMVASGLTYIPSGLIWGWRTLALGGPFADGSANRRKVAVLMTDGANTRSATYTGDVGFHDGNDIAQSNAWTLELCSRMKAARIEIYAVAFDVSDNAVKDMLAACASGPPYFYDARNVGDLGDAFEQIASNMTVMRVKK